MKKLKKKKKKQGQTYTYPIETKKKSPPKKIKLKKPQSKSVRKAKKRIDEIKDMLPLSQYIPKHATNPNSYITNEDAYSQANETMAIVKKALKKSRKFM